MGLGKRRSRLGKWLDKNDKTQEWLTRESGLGRNTISYLTAEDDRTPNTKTIQRILKAVRTVDPNIKADDFWPM